MATVRRSPQTETDLETSLEDLQLQNPAVAERYANEFYDKGKTLAQIPEIGSSRPEIAPHLRSTLVKALRDLLPHPRR